MITNSGSGYSRWKEIAVTRLAVEDVSRDDAGMFCYLARRDVQRGLVHTVSSRRGSRPRCTRPFFLNRGLSSVATVILNWKHIPRWPCRQEDDVEHARRIKITNRSRSQTFTIELTSYAEVVMADAAVAMRTHPAFSKLFVQTEIVPDRQGILCTRRPRLRRTSIHRQMLHPMSAQVWYGGWYDLLQETDRAKFLGRGRDAANPQAMAAAHGSLPNSEGSVLDPIGGHPLDDLAGAGRNSRGRRRSGVGETREVALSLIEKYHDRDLAERLLDLAWTHSQVILQQLNATEPVAQNYAFALWQLDRFMRAISRAAQHQCVSKKLKRSIGFVGTWHLRRFANYARADLRIVKSH